MRHILKLAHIVAAAGFIGGLAVTLLLATGAEEPTPTGFAAVRRAAATAVQDIAVPSLVLLVLSGMLLAVQQPAFLEARWVWAKAVLGMLAGGLVLLVVQPAVRQAAALAQAAAQGSLAGALLEAALRAEWIGGLACIAIGVAAAALAVWRPVLGRRRGEGASADG